MVSVSLALVKKNNNSTLPVLGQHLSGGVKYSGVGKSCDFQQSQQKSPFISEMAQDKPVVTANHYYEVIGSQLIHNGSNDLEWPWKVEVRGQIFLGISAVMLICRIVWPKTTRFGTLICLWETYFQWDNHTSITGAELQRPQTFWDLPMLIQFDLEWPNLAW